MRILITGGPRTGKTTLGHTLQNQHGIPCMHTDDAIEGRSWSEASAEVARWLEHDNEEFLIEGVAVPRALRKYMKAHPGERPCDELIIRANTFSDLTKGQLAMTKGLHTVLAEILPELERLGVKVTRS